ncbi:MAG TPA: glycosyltransferase [Kofleriaceae bacterium]|nr:glycosyltransferase [Kofleriaceae bacterium]
MIQRVLVAPLNYSHRQRGQVEAFQAVFGADNVREFDWMARHREGKNASAALAAAAAQFRPDWIWIQAQGADGLDPVRVRQIREAIPSCFITHWMGDCRAHVPEQLAYMCQATHATLISNTGQHGMYHRAGARRVHYVQIGLDPEDVQPGTWERPLQVPDVVFCGGYYGHVDQFWEGTQLRLRAIRAIVGHGINIGVVGRGWPDDIPRVGECHVKEQIHVYKRARVALSINHFNNIPLYYSDRQLIAMASGTPVVAKYIPDLELEFTHGTHCLFWRTIDELVSGVKELLADERLAATIGHNGQHKVLSEHTWYERIKALRPVVEGWRKEDCKL